MTASRRPEPPAHLSDRARAFLARPVPPGAYPADADVAGWLAFVDAADAALRGRFTEVEDLAVERTEIGGVPTYTFQPPGVPPDAPVYLDLHGGALVLGGGELCRLMAAGPAATKRLLTWAPDYRMPPLHPYPVPLEDCLAVYEALLAVRDPADVFVGGTSAGGNLAAALVVRARDAGLPLPAGLVLLSPELDLSESGDSFRTNLGVDIMGSLTAPSRLYAAGRDLADPAVSPLFADVTGFPPTFLQCGTRDLFLSNTVRMHRKLRAAGVDAVLHVFEAMPHGGFAGAPEDRELAGEVAAFLDDLRSRRQPAGSGSNR